MANKNLIRRMRQLLILVLILAMTMSFATMTAMATPGNGNGNGVGQQSIHIHLNNGTLPAGVITLTINELNADGTSKYTISVSGTVNGGGNLISAVLGENNGISTISTKIEYLDANGNRGVITLTQKGEGNDIGQDGITHPDKGLNNYWASFTQYEPIENPAPASLSLTAKKTLDGNAPGVKTFSFTLKKGDTEVDTAVNNNSNISFKELTFKEAGTYTYTISEVKGTDDDITHDETVYTVEVVVTKEGNALVATPTYKKAGEVVQEAVFANTTKESGNGGNGNGGDGNGGNGGNNGGNTGGNGGQFPPDQNLDDPDTPNTPAEPVEPSEKPLPDDKHTVTEVPKTGDAVANALLFNLLLLSISALAGTVFYLRRKMTDR